MKLEPIQDLVATDLAEVDRIIRWFMMRSDTLL
jgi:hypothetical protein